ncbi:MAG: phospholipase D-like domain-containing protein [Herpetosiphon sp.]
MIHDDELRIYTYGQDVFDDMLAAIDAAKECIYFETFIWKGDKVGQAIKERLCQKAASGIAVYVIYDGFANLVVRPAFKEFPKAVHCMEYRTLHRMWYVLDPRRYARDHRKLLVVDHKVAFIGGYNIGQLYATEWRDTHLRIEGPGALDLGFSFVDFWNTHHEADSITWDKARAWLDPLKVHRNDPARLVFPIRGMYLDAIERANHHIYLTNAYFIPDRIILAALIAAAKRGVDVRVLVPWQSNHVTADWLARGYFSRCLQNGIRIFGFKGAMIHAKTATIDGAWSTIGTANLDRLSLSGNYEINVEIRNEGIAQEMERIYEMDLSNAFEMTQDQWNRRPWYMRATQLALSPLRPLL